MPDVPDRDEPDREASHRAHRPDESEGSAGSSGQTAVSIREAAVLTDRSEAAIYHLIATGQLPAQPTASRGLTIHPRDLEKLERHSTDFRRSGWTVQSVRDWIRQRGQVAVRRLRAGMRSVLPHMLWDLRGPPWYWIMPCCAVLAARW